MRQHPVPNGSGAREDGISEERPPTPAGGWWQDERGRWRQGPRPEQTPSDDAGAAAAAGGAPAELQPAPESPAPEPRPEPAPPEPEPAPPEPEAAPPEPEAAPPAPDPGPEPGQPEHTAAPTATPAPPSSPLVPAGEWGQDESGRWQQGPRATAPTRLDEIREQIGSLDGASRFLGRKEIKELPNILWEDERVERLIQGTYNSRMGVLVATNKRLVFVDKGIARLRVEDFPYDKLTSIQYQTGLMMGTVTIFASGNRADIQNVVKDQCRAFADYVRARISGPAAHASVAAAPPAPPPAGDMLEQLERLGRLRDSGVLSPEEFEQQKQRILGMT